MWLISHKYQCSTPFLFSNVQIRRLEMAIGIRASLMRENEDEN